MTIIDANVVLRYILSDHEELSETARQVIDKQTVEIPIEVLCEVVFVLSSVYHASHEAIGTELIGFFEKTPCVLPHREAVLRGLDLFSKKNLDFVDCILAGYCNAENAEIYTFDKQLQKLLHE
jgi:predicted nucleic-acid-binding protein